MNKTQLEQLVTRIIREELATGKENTVNEDQDDTEYITTTDGTPKTADSQTRMKAQKDGDKGKKVVFRKKGQSLSENSEEPIDEDINEEVNSIIPIKKAVHDAIVGLESLLGTSQDSRYKRYAQAAIKHLERAEDCLDDVKVLEEKANDKKAKEDAKADDKHSDAVFKHISKKLSSRNKKQDIEPIKVKYDKVAKKLRTASKHADPTRHAEAIWKHMLKEGSFVQMPASVNKNDSSKIDTAHPIKINRYSAETKNGNKTPIEGKIQFVPEKNGYPALIVLTGEDGKPKANIMFDDKDGYCEAKGSHNMHIRYEPVDEYAKKAFEYLKAQS